jgi:hypothetical protein
MILLGRILVGIGAGNQVVSQVWFSWITNDQQRPIVRSAFLLSHAQFANQLAYLFPIAADYGCC